jgi:hypothetical protein
MDATGLYALEEVARELHAANRTLILCGAREQPGQLIRQAEFEDLILDAKIFARTCKKLCGGKKMFLREWRTRPRRAPSESVLPRGRTHPPIRTPAKTQRIFSYLLLAAAGGGAAEVIPK